MPASLFVALCLVALAVSQSCVDNLGQRGLCMERSACRGHSKPGYCPGAASIQCCITSERAHIVRPGETMWGIAQHERVPFSLLETANKQIRNPDRVWPNDRVWVPGFATSVRRPRVTTGGRGSATRTRGATTGRPSSPTTARRTTSRRSTTRRSTTRPSATTGRSTTRRRRSTTRRPSTPTTAPSDGSSGGSINGISASFITLIRQREGFNQRVYRDSLGNPTAGTGHLLSAAERARYPVGTLVPMSVINQWFANDAGPAYRAGVRQAAQAGLSSDQRAKDVFGSMSFQLGLGWPQELPGLWRLIVARSYGAAEADAEATLWARQTPVRAHDLISMLRDITQGAARARN